jgi:F-box domain
MLAIIKIVASECGFRGENSNLIDQIGNPHKFKLNFTKDDDKQIEIIMVETGDLLLISCYFLSFKSVVTTHSLVLPMSRYLPYRIITKPVSKFFKNYSELSYKLKEFLFVPVRNEIFSSYWPLPTSEMPYLLGLPDVILCKIFKKLSKSDAQKFKLVSRRIYQIYLKYVKNK